MLVERSHHPIVDVRSPWHRLKRSNGDCGKNTSGLDSVMETSRLVEMPHEDIFVVADGDDCLQYQNSRPNNRDLLGSPVRVLPANSVVDFMHTDGVGLLDRFAVRVTKGKLEILEGEKS